jgi:hypothetical protein
MKKWKLTETGLSDTLIFVKNLSFMPLYYKEGQWPQFWTEIQIYKDFCWVLSHYASLQYSNAILEPIFVQKHGGNHHVSSVLKSRFKETTTTKLLHQPSVIQVTWVHNHIIVFVPKKIWKSILPPGIYITCILPHSSLSCMCMCAGIRHAKYLMAKQEEKQ